MNKKTTTAVATVADEKSLAMLKEQFPAEAGGFTRAILPRIGMFSQDKTEGKGKSMKVVAEAGTFYIEHQSDEEDQNGKKIWVKDEIGTELEAVIIYQRRQLSYYDGDTELYTSSPVYDTDDEVIPLFCDKKEIDRGTPAELKGREEYVYEKDGKTKSHLEENRILYVLYKEDVYQMNLRGTSMFAFMTYARKVLPPAVLTAFGSEAKEKGTISWNQMSFNKVKDLDNDEVTDVLERVSDIKSGIASEKSYFASISVQQVKANKEFEDFN